LGGVSDLAREETVQPGEPMVLRPEAGVQWLKVTPPHGSAETLKRGPRPDFTFSDTDQLGVYRVQRDDGAERSFAVNLLDGNESNIEPREEIQVGTETVASGRERPQPYEVWKWVVLLALGLLCLEWYIYNRRIYI